MFYVKEQAMNLSVSFPDIIPHRSVFFNISLVGTLTTNWRSLVISAWEYLDGRIDTLIWGGLEATMPHHAIVMALALSFSLSRQLTRTTGKG